MTASEALELAEKALQPLAQSELDNILKLIRQAAEKGNLSVRDYKFTSEGTVLGYVLKQLKALGYTYYTRDDEYFSIYWMSPKNGNT